MADFSYTCPWCSRQVDLESLYDYDELLGECIYGEDEYPFCSKPITLDVWVTAHVSVAKSDKAERAEREKYEKRMRGDWS